MSFKFVGNNHRCFTTTPPVSQVHGFGIHPMIHGVVVVFAVVLQVAVVLQMDCSGCGAPGERHREGPALSYLNEIFRHFGLEHGNRKVVG